MSALLAGILLLAAIVTVTWAILPLLSEDGQQAPRSREAERLTAVRTAFLTLRAVPLAAPVPCVPALPAGSLRPVPIANAEVHHWAAVAHQGCQCQKCARERAEAYAPKHLRRSWADDTDSFAAFCGVA
jgi:hypothetical protein